MGLPPIFVGVRVANFFFLSVLCLLFLFVFILCLVYPMLSVYVDYLFLIAPSVFSNIYLLFEIFLFIFLSGSMFKTLIYGNSHHGFSINTHKNQTLSEGSPKEHSSQVCKMFRSMSGYNWSSGSREKSLKCKKLMDANDNNGYKVTTIPHLDFIVFNQKLAI